MYSGCLEISMPAWPQRQESFNITDVISAAPAGR
jgi:hypothetical protein